MPFADMRLIENPQYRRGSKFVVVYRVDGRQRKQSADTLADARAIKLVRSAVVIPLIAWLDEDVEDRGKQV